MRSGGHIIAWADDWEVSGGDDTADHAGVNPSRERGLFGIPGAQQSCSRMSHLQAARHADRELPSEHAGCRAADDIKITCFSRPLPAFKQAESMVLKCHYIGEYF